MDLKVLSEEKKGQYNKLVNHIMQSWEWGEFRKRLGTRLQRFGIYQEGKLTQAFQLTFHKIPLTSFYVGYLPKGPFPDKDLAQALSQIGKEERCAFIKVEPNVEESRIKSSTLRSQTEGNQELRIDNNFHQSPKPLFTKFNYVLDLTKSEEEILKNMHPKFRYNIKVAQKHKVWVEERVDDEALDIHLKLHFQTTKRQGFHSHNESYHRKVWEDLKRAGIAKILIAFFKPEENSTPIPLTSWMLFIFKDTLYYPYGGSSEEHKNVMASNLLAWEAIKLGKKLGLKKFDLWGAGDPSKGSLDPYSGFTSFKSKMGAELVQYLGTYDLILNWPIYILFNLVEKATPVKIFLLKLLKNEEYKNSKS